MAAKHQKAARAVRRVTQIAAELRRLYADEIRALKQMEKQANEAAEYMHLVGWERLAINAQGETYLKQGWTKGYFYGAARTQAKGYRREWEMLKLRQEKGLPLPMRVSVAPVRRVDRVELSRAQLLTASEAAELSASIGW